VLQPSPSSEAATEREQHLIERDGPAVGRFENEPAFVAGLGVAVMCTWAGGGRVSFGSTQPAVAQRRSRSRNPSAPGVACSKPALDAMLGIVTGPNLGGTERLLCGASRFITSSTMEIQLCFADAELPAFLESHVDASKMPGFALGGEDPVPVPLRLARGAGRTPV